MLIEWGIANPDRREQDVSNSHESRVFIRRKTPHVLILASGDKVRHITVRPWIGGIAFGLVGAACIGYLAATAYLVLRDDLIGATMARQARMQFEYEDRIAALRAQVDRVTSRQMLDQQVVEDKVEKLLERQNALTSRNGKLGSLFDRAEASGLTSQAGESKQQASLDTGANAIDHLLGKDDKPSEQPALAFAPVAGESAGDRADRLFSSMTLSLKSIEQDQVSKVESLTAGATQTAEEMENIILRTGLPVPPSDQKPVSADANADAEGGPFIDPVNQDEFETSLARLDTALGRLEAVRATAMRLPFANPAPGRDITSTFGNRTDPFLGKLAMHTGVDFRFKTGEQVPSTGAGKVINAGPASGYGNLVEIDHGNGITTRYGHLSQILVAVGDRVNAGDIVGLAGSTGRSTGPHLHYEVRYMGEPENPMRFLQAGAKLDRYLR